MTLPRSLDRKRPLTAIVIGAGSGGLTVAIGLARLGRQVALVEADRVGGDCTNVGCIPSKTLLHRTRTTGSADGGRVLSEVRAVRSALERHERADLEAHPGIRLLRGTARLDGADRVTVTADDVTSTLTARHVVIATGSTPVTIEIPGLPRHRVLTNETLFEIAEPPRHLAIIGGGPIGLEMATAFARLDSTVTVIEAADRLLPRETPEAGAILAAALRERGIAVHTGSAATSFEEGTRTLSLADGTRITAVDAVLMTIGRRPRSEDLDLDRHRVATDRGAVRVDPWGRTSVKGIWAVGDVTGRTATTHGAGAMGRRIVRAIGLPLLPRLARAGAIPSAVFSEPEVAAVGHPVDLLERRWPAAARHRIRVDLADTDRGLTDQVRHGAIVVDVERLTGKVLRATIVGQAAAEAIGLFTLAIDRGISMHRIFTMTHPYPTFSSAIATAADEFTRLTLTNLPAEAGAWARSLPSTLKRRP